MDRSRSYSSFLAALALVGFLAVACDSGTQEPAAPTPAVPATAPGDGDGDAASANASPATSGVVDPSRLPTDLPEGVTAAIPDNFPQDVPIYPGAEPAQGKGAQLEGVPMSAVQLVTRDSPGDVYSFYLDKLSSSGWQIENSRDLDRNAAISASNGRCSVSLLVSPTSDGGSDVFIITEC
ncbi:MAG: hypothetical protein CL908_11475 [Deltaproteobacteria bacterium]|jgi:hypothetical protein|nr:hypothetical protein [Deltaproteobacteria bacterium]